MNIRVLFTLVIAGFIGSAQARDDSANTQHVTSATAVSRVLGDGRKVETVILEYDAPINNRSLSADIYEVEGRELTP
ncbi:MAG: hypothetical protein K2O07_07485, partial [Alistipes sp.]|nr:hypothetical protein [Alistipes sp.]